MVAVAAATTEDSVTEGGPVVAGVTDVVNGGDKTQSAVETSSQMSSVNESLCIAAPSKINSQLINAPLVRFFTDNSKIG